MAASAEISCIFFFFHVYNAHAHQKSLGHLNFLTKANKGAN